MNANEKRWPVQKCRLTECVEPTHQDGTIPESLARAGYDAYASRYGTRQSFERIHERGGLSWDELVMFVPRFVNPHIDPSGESR